MSTQWLPNACDIPSDAYDQGMKRHPAFIRFFSVFAVFALLCPLGRAVPAAAEQAQSGISGAELLIEGPLRVGHRVTARFDLKGYEIPAGAYASVNPAFLERPEGERPQIIPGYPETVMIFRAPGTYRLFFILSEVTKSSCGGVDARTLLESERELVIFP
jgi:hypothetical protein